MSEECKNVKIDLIKLVTEYEGLEKQKEVKDKVMREQDKEVQRAELKRDKKMIEEWKALRLNSFNKIMELDDKMRKKMFDITLMAKKWKECELKGL